MVHFHPPGRIGDFARSSRAEEPARRHARRAGAGAAGGVPGDGGATEPVTASARWIVPTGGGYFFGPSLQTLPVLADGGDLS
jgi:hypothetical protein